MAQERTNLVISAIDVDEAVARAQSELGVSPDQLHVDVLDDGDPEEGREARVRVSLRDDEGPPPDGPYIDTVLQVVKDLLDHMDIEADVTVRHRDEEATTDEHPLMVDIDGEDLDDLIGRRGETLEALQYIIRIVTARRYGQRTNLVVDVDGYKVRHEQQLGRLAQRLAGQVIQQGRTIELEPMPPRDRRIIHISLQDHPQVSTASAGEGEFRRVTIYLQ